MKIFLESVSSDPDIRKLVTENVSDFSRERKLPLQRIAGIIINMPKRSLSIEIQEFFDGLGNGLESCTKGAFSLQRSKLKPLFFKVWNKWLVDNFYNYYGEHVKRWRGFGLQAADGSTAYLLDKEDIVKHFGTHDNQHVSTPMARVMQVHDILNDITVWGDIFPIAESEQAIIAKQVSELATDSLTIFDRGFAGYGLMYLMINEETPRHFIIRCKTTFNKEVIEFARSGKRSKIVELKPSYKSIVMLKGNGYIINANTTIKVRMVQVNLPNGEQEILLTNLYDEKLYTIDDLKYLYGLRWGIETAYGKQKNQQQLEQFSGHRVVCIEQDYAATIFVANLQSLIEKQCDNNLHIINRKRKHKYRINRNVSWASLKHTIIQLFITEEPEKILIQLQKAFERNIEPVRPGRQYRRSTKAKRLTGKYQTFTNYKRAI
ncbi:MAG: IS4 family transposase [Segetibacter sp.]